MSYPKIFYNLLQLNAMRDMRKDADAKLHNAAIQSSMHGEREKAIGQYQELLVRNNQNIIYLRELAQLYAQNNQARQALETIFEALRLDLNEPLLHNTFGQLLIQHLNRAEHNEFIQTYLKVIGAEDLASILVDAEIFCLEKYAEHILSDCLTGSERDLREAWRYVQRGNLLLATQHVADAVDQFATACKCEPRDPTLRHYYATALALIGKDRESFIEAGHGHFVGKNFSAAIAAYENALDKEICPPCVYNRLAQCYNRKRRFAQTIQLCSELAAKHFTMEPILLYEWIGALQGIGKIEQSLQLAQKASQEHPQSILLSIQRAQLLPLLYQTTDEIEQNRRRIAENFEHIYRVLLQVPDDGVDEAYEALRETNFYLAYQTQNDRTLQKKFGKIVENLLERKFPQWQQPLTTRAIEADEPIRIGYVAPYFFYHTVGKLFYGWLANRDREKFLVTTYYLLHREDLLSQEFRQISDEYHHFPNDVEAACEQIASDKPHILIFPSIGMHMKSMLIAGLRLAPIQCVSWGHPITTGLSTIDYFISSDLMEPDDADEHYSETLVRLPGIGVSVPPPYAPPLIKSRSDYGLPDDAVIYFSPQSTFKYLPQYDFLYPKIARRVPEAKFVFLTLQGQEITNLFKERLAKAFAAEGLESEQFVIFLSRKTHPDYIALNQLADIFLDTPGWSGGMTTLEAIGCGLPVVTCPGEFMRGRHAYAILIQLGIAETIADDLTKYIDIAVRLGLNHTWRYEIEEQILKNHSRLFDDTDCVQALENFFIEAVSKHSSQPNRI